MWRNLGLPACVLMAGWQCIPAQSAGLDPSFGIQPDTQWSYTSLNRPIFLPPAPPRSALKHLSQAETEPKQPGGETAFPAIPEAAVKAEMEQRWSDAEGIY